MGHASEIAVDCNQLAGISVAIDRLVATVQELQNRDAVVFVEDNFRGVTGRGGKSEKSQQGAAAHEGLARPALSEQSDDRKR